MADKGGRIVVLYKADYVKELDRLVSDSNTYKKLKSNPTNKLRLLLKRLVRKAHKEGILTKEAWCAHVTGIVPIAKDSNKINPPGDQ